MSMEKKKKKVKLDYYFLTFESVIISYPYKVALAGAVASRWSRSGITKTRHPGNNGNKAERIARLFRGNGSSRRSSSCCFVAQAGGVRHQWSHVYPKCVYIIIYTKRVPPFFSTPALCARIRAEADHCRDIFASQLASQTCMVSPPLSLSLCLAFIYKFAAIGCCRICRCCVLIFSLLLRHPVFTPRDFRLFPFCGLFNSVRNNIILIFSTIIRVLIPI